MKRLVSYCVLAVTLTLICRNATAQNSFPTAKPAPIQITVIGDGKYEVRDWELAFFSHTGQFYVQADDYDVEHLSLYQGSAVRLELPLSSVHQVEIVGGGNSVTGYAAVIALTDGTELRGVLAEPEKGQRRPVVGMRGRGVVQGFPASIDLRLEKVAKVVFNKPSSGKMAAECFQKDGTQTKIDEVKFRVEGGTSLAATSRVQVLEFVVGDSTLEVPLADISALKFSNRANTDRAELNLRKGSSLVGRVAKRYVLYGTSSSSGKPVPFVANIEVIKSIEFQ